MNKKIFFVFWSLSLLLLSACSDKTFLRDPYAWKETYGGSVVNNDKPYEDTIAVLTHRINTLSKKLAIVSEEDLKYAPTQQYPSTKKFVSKKTPTPYYPYYTKGQNERDYAKLRLGGPVQKEFYRAYANFRKGKYNFATILFSRFVEKYPYHYLDDDAVFLSGESYYLQREYFLAIDEYKKVLSKYPTSNKKVEATLRLAISYRRLNNRSQAKKYYRMVIAKYPSTKEARIARSQISTL